MLSGPSVGAVDAHPRPAPVAKESDDVECAALLDWSRSGWLDRQEITRLSRVLNQAVTIRSCLPSGEDDAFPDWDLVPAEFLSDVLVRVKGSGMTAVSWLIGPRATEILHGDTAAGGTTNNSAGATRESRFSIGGSDDDEDDDDAASERVPMRHPTAIVPPPDGAPRGELQLQQTRVRVVITTPCPRDALGDVRDAVLAALRSVAPTPDGDNTPDHMLAGAYLRQMMVVDESEFEEGMRTAIFTFASFDERPEVFTLEFQACPDGIERSRAVTGALAALVDHDRIRIDTTSLRWLQTHGNTLLDPELNESDVSDDCDPIATEDPSVSGGWKALSGHVQPPTVLFCRRHADAEANGKEGTLMAQLRDIASGITSCFAACLGFRKGRVAEDCELTPRPNRSVPPPLLVHEI